MLQVLSRKFGSIFLTFCFISVQLQWAPIAKAEMISTTQVITLQTPNDSKAKLKTIIQQEEAKAIFNRLGVSSAEIEARLAQLTPEELALLNEQAELQPAGSSLVGIAIFIAILLAVTDLVGLTDIYPFIDSIN